MDDAEVVGGAATVAEQPDNLEAFLRSLAGHSGVYCKVRRVGQDGQEVWLTGSIPLRDADPDSLIDAIARRWGSGEYILQFRRQGSRGSLQNAGPIHIETDHVPAAALPAAAAADPMENPIAKLLMEQQRELMGVIRDSLTNRGGGGGDMGSGGSALAGGGLGGQLKELVTLLDFARKLNGEAAVPDWLARVGEVAGPAVAQVAQWLGQRMEQSNKPSPARRVAPPPAQANGVAGIEPDDEEDDGEEDAGDDPIGAGLRVLFSAAAQASNPDAAAYAKLLLDLDRAQVAQQLQSLPVGGLPGLVAAIVPELAGKQEFLAALEQHLRAALQPQGDQGDAHK